MAEKITHISADEARIMLNRILKQRLGGWYVEPPRTRVQFDQMHRLDRRQIDQGVIALKLACNLEGGSIGDDINLYKLVNNYLRHADAREKINRIVDDCERRNGAQIATSNNSGLNPTH